MPRLVLTDLSIRSLKADQRIDYWDTRLPSFGIRVGPRSKTFIVKAGKGRRAIGTYPALSLQQARREAMVLKLMPMKPISEITFEEALKAFDTLHCSQKKARTRKDYLCTLNRHFSPKFRVRRLADIRHSDVMKITDKLMETPSERSHALAVARGFWKFCLRRRYVDRSPLENVQLPKLPSRERVLTDCELRCLWRACDDDAAPDATDPEPEDRLHVSGARPIGRTFATIVKLLILTGQRKSEIASLQISWIKEHEITLPRTITKNSREHTLPIGVTAKALISAASDSLPSYLQSPSQILFPARGTISTPFNGFSKSKSALDKKLGEKVAPWTLHDLRRTFATNMARLGVRLEVTEKLLNHISGSQGGIVGIYQRYDFKDEMRAAVHLWEERLRAIVATTPDVQT